MINDTEEEQANDLFHQLNLEISEYVENSPGSTNTQLFSILSLLNAYLPESSLLMEQCQKILGPPDAIHGGPPFEERMQPFSTLIRVESERVYLIHQVTAEKSVELLHSLKISRSATVDKYMNLLCGQMNPPEVIQLIKDLLTQRQMDNGKKKWFSNLITDIMEQEKFSKAVWVLQSASDKFKQVHIFPQTVARLFLQKERYNEAVEWAKTAIERAENNSYVADTLGQVYKKELKGVNNSSSVEEKAKLAFEAFKKVEEKAEREEGPEMTDMAGLINVSDSFNNRGLFGFCQVAKMVHEKLGHEVAISLLADRIMEVDAKFEFFEWYLSYSKPDIETDEPDYFWKDVVLCYERYTGKKAADSSSFPGLIDCLNHGRFNSKGKRAGFSETEITTESLQGVRDRCKTFSDDVKVAERYILSSILVSNRLPHGPQDTVVEELQGIVRGFLQTEERHRSPEFYLLALMLFWPEDNPQPLPKKEENGSRHETTEDSGPQDQCYEEGDTDEEEDRGREPKVSPDQLFEPDLQGLVTLMSEAYKRAKYAKYLRGRYLLPLFYLGRGSGLNRWVHRSRLDAIVEAKVDAETSNTPINSEEKRKEINYLWSSGKVWQIGKIQEILQPVKLESVTTEENEVFFYAGGMKIRDRADNEPEQGPVFYLCFNIQGPLVFSNCSRTPTGQ
ncbi:sterile alpha motif domain-containing protein 9-like isoform 1-T2 [Menidia menidia]